MTRGGARLQLNILEFYAVFYCLLRNSRLCTEAEPRTTRGGRPLYSALAILTALTLRAVFRLAYRTRLKLCGAGEWLVEKHGTKARRAWRKLHLGVDADTGQIVASALTSKEIDDEVQVGPLLDQVAGSLSSFTADGAYDQDGVYATVADRHPETEVIVPPRITAVLSHETTTRPPLSSSVSCGQCPAETPEASVAHRRSAHRISSLGNIRSHPRGPRLLAGRSADF